jgi:hypothetical protein
MTAQGLQSLHPFGIAHWVQVLSKIKTLGVNRIDSCNFELCLQGRLCITNNSTVFKDGPSFVSNKISDYHPKMPEVVV